MKKFDFKNIELIVYDFDGVMTDNTTTVDQNGNESVVVNRSDGLAISLIKKMGIKQIILSTETNNVVMKRAEKLNLFCLNGVANKAITLKNYLMKENINPESVLYVGNDINDFEVMQMIGFSVAPKDSSKEILSIANYVSKQNGGKGVIRDMLYLLKTDQELINLL